MPNSYAVYVISVFLVPKITSDCGSGSLYFDFRVQFSHHDLRKYIKCVFFRGYVLNIKHFPCDKVLYSFHSNIHFENAFAKLQNECKLRYVGLSVSPFVILFDLMELLSSKWTEFHGKEFKLFYYF